MKIAVTHPVTIRVDNIGVTFMASNVTTTCYTKHVDIKYKYVNEYVKDEVVKIGFAKFAKSDSNILTKNLSAELHKKHSKNEDVRGFKVKRKGFKEDVLTLNILFDDFPVTRVSST